MADLADRIRTRVLPALLTAFGVAGLAVGMLSLTSSVTADPLPSASPTAVAAASIEPTPTALITFPPVPSRAPSEAPSASPTAAVERFATRVRIAALKIDLAVINPPGGADAYPLCDVATPTRGPACSCRSWTPRSSLMALECSGSWRRSGPVATSATCTRSPRSAATRRTSTTPSTQPARNSGFRRPKDLVSQPGKTQVIATLLSEGTADPADAHPVPKPVECT